MAKLTKNEAKFKGKQGQGPRTNARPKAQGTRERTKGPNSMGHKESRETIAKRLAQVMQIQERRRNACTNKTALPLQP